jgi:hypothetical protein
VKAGRGCQPVCLLRRSFSVFFVAIDVNDDEPWRFTTLAETRNALDLFRHHHPPMVSNGDTRRGPGRVRLSPLFAFVPL